MRNNLSKSSMRKIITQLENEKSALYQYIEELEQKIGMLETDISDLQRDCVDPSVIQFYENRIQMLEDFYCGGDEIGF